LDKNNEIKNDLKNSPHNIEWKMEPTTELMEEEIPVSIEKRPRGRPRKERVISDELTEPKKRGRPAGTSTASKSSTEVDQALATLETAYQFVVLGLTMVGAPNAGSDLAEKIEFLQEQNKGFLTADRKLAQRIANVGSASGRAGFMITNLIALAPVVMTAAKEIQSRKPVKVSATVQPETKPETDKADPDITVAPVSNYGLVMDTE
jgi:hypothetical protein